MSPLTTTIIFLIAAAISAVNGGVFAGENCIDPELAVAEAGANVIEVRKDGRGKFRTVGEALKSIPEWSTTRWIVRIGGGEYWEKITIERSKPFVTLYGLPWEMPVIVFNGTAAEYGTLNSATVAVESDYFVAVNIVFKVSYV